jgi:hypothetical protein
MWSNYFDLVPNGRYFFFTWRFFITPLLSSTFLSIVELFLTFLCYQCWMALNALSCSNLKTILLKFSFHKQTTMFIWQIMLNFISCYIEFRLPLWYLQTLHSNIFAACLLFLVLWYCFDNYFTYFVPVFKYCYSDSRNLWTVMRAGGLAP